MKFKTFLAGLIIASVFCVSTTALAMTEQERQALIAQIESQLSQLYQQVAQMQSQQGSTITSNLSSVPTNWCHTFNSNIKYGVTGAEVAALHVALQNQGMYIPSSEQSIQYFGDYTTTAVNSFQEKYASEILWPLGLTKGTSFVGTSTRAKLNQFYGCTSGVVCAQDAKQCPDGSYVSRVAPNCDFAPCPTTSCIPSWYCSSWSDCVNGQQTRTCTDSNYCGTTTGKPATTQSCSTNSADDNTNNSNQQNTNVTVNIVFTANNSSGSILNLGVNSVNLRWSAIPGNYCTASGDWSGGKNASGTETVVLIKTSMNFVITCTSAPNGIVLGRASKSITVNTTNPQVSISTKINTCVPNWICGSWNFCVNGQQTRTCTDSNNCGITTNKPATTQTCTATCSPNQKYSDWSTCINGQIRTVTDLNKCGGGTGISFETRSTPEFIKCSDWSDCVNNRQTRTCPDSILCEPENKPILIRDCVSPASLQVEAKGVNEKFEHVSQSPMYDQFNGYVVNSYLRTIPYNTPVKLTWTSINATSCTASGDWFGAKPSSGSETTGNLTFSKAFALTCTDINNADRKVKVVENIIVESLYPPTIAGAYLRANHQDDEIVIPYGGSVTLTWGFCLYSSFSTSGVPLSNTPAPIASGGWSGTKALAGSETINNITSNTDYTLTTDMVPGISPSRSKTVRVMIEQPKVILKANNIEQGVLFSSAPATNIPYNSTVNLSWTSTGKITSCTASGDWSGAKPSSGSETTAALNTFPNYRKIFIIQCVGPGGTASSSVIVGVNNP